MTIVIFIDWFLPAYKAGGPVQTIANLVARPEEGLHYQIICSNRDLDNSVLAVIPDRWLRFNPWTEVYHTSKGVKGTLLGRREDTLFINGMYSWNFSLKPVLFSKSKRIIVSPRGMLHKGALSQKAWKKWLYLRAWRLAGLHRKVEFHATDETEGAAIRRVFGREVKIHLAANWPKQVAPQPMPLKRKGELQLLTVALISPMKNILQVLQALQTVPEPLCYHIYGPVKSRAYWQQCKIVIGSLPSHIRVTYHGDLHPSRLEEVLQRCHIFILPSKSENFGHALYEALSAARPVITSHGTPWNGLEAATAGKNINPENGQEITDAIRFFGAMTGESLEYWNQGARRYAEGALNREEIKQQYRCMFGVYKPALPVT